MVFALIDWMRVYELMVDNRHDETIGQSFQSQLLLDTAIVKYWCHNAV